MHFVHGASSLGIREEDVHRLSFILGQGNRRPGSGQVLCCPRPIWPASSCGHLPEEGTHSATVLPGDKGQVSVWGWHPLCTGGKAEMRVHVILPAAGLLWALPHPQATGRLRPWPRCHGTCISCTGSTSAASRKNSTSCPLCKWQESPWHMSTPEIQGGGAL